MSFRFVDKAGVWVGDSLWSLDSLCSQSNRYVLLKPLKLCNNTSVCSESVYTECVQVLCSMAMQQHKAVGRETATVSIKLHRGINVRWREIHFFREVLCVCEVYVRKWLRSRGLLWF